MSTSVMLPTTVMKSNTFHESRKKFYTKQEHMSYFMYSTVLLGSLTYSMRSWAGIAMTSVLLRVQTKYNCSNALE